MSYRPVYRGHREGRHQVDWDGVAGDPFRFVLVADGTLEGRVWAASMLSCSSGDTVDADVSLREPTSDELALIEGTGVADPSVVVVDFGAGAQGRWIYDVQHSASADRADDPQTVMGGEVGVFRQVTR